MKNESAKPSMKGLITQLRKAHGKPYHDIETNPLLLANAKDHADKLIKTKKILKAGNRKLDESVLIFNLPDAYTCPGASLGCLQFCYARPAKSSNPRSTSLARYARYLVTLRNDFVNIMVNELKSRRKRVVRVHESGDFYSVEYFRKWLKIARKLPNIQFYAYTKSWFIAQHLEELTDNFVIIFSLDNTNFRLFKGLLARIAEARRKGKRVGISYVNTHTQEDKQNLLEIAKYIRIRLCLATIPKMKGKIKCGKDCTYCSTNPDCVIFNVH